MSKGSLHLKEVVVLHMTRKKSRWAATVIATCGLALAATPVLAQEVGEGDVRAVGVHSPFAVVEAPATAIPLKHSRSFIAVRPDLAALARVQQGDRVEIPVSPTRNLSVVFDLVESRTPTQRSFRGMVEGAPDSSVLVVLNEDAVAGDIRVGRDHFRFRFVAGGGGVHLVCDIDDRGYAECGGASPAPVDAPWRGVDYEPEAEIPADAPPGNPEAGSCSNIEITFDVMVIYSDVARAAAGGTTAMQAEIQLGVDTSNLTYDNSAVGARYRLVWQGEVDYDENGPMTAHRDRLPDTTDGYYDWVPATKDSINADMCSIWVDDDDGGQWCGFALCDFTGDMAYCSVNWECAAGNLSYPHEHGHNQGSDHNPEDGGSCTEYSYSNGHRFFAGGDGYRTVMAYNNDAGDFSRRPYWSNPNVNFLGTPTGTATRDNARSLNDTRGTVEGWELTRLDIWIDEDPAFPGIQIGTFSLPYDTAAEGFAAIGIPSGSVSIVPILHVVTGTYNYTGTVNKDMTIVPCGGVATIGTP